MVRILLLQYPSSEENGEGFSILSIISLFKEVLLDTELKPIIISYSSIVSISMKQHLHEAGTGYTCIPFFVPLVSKGTSHHTRLN